MTAADSQKFKVLDMVYIALFAVLIAVCTWISVPAAVPFTMQTFAVFCALGLLGGKRGTFSVIVYLLLGAVGVPVFSGFRGGIGVLFDTTGGYLIGFIIMALLYWLITALLGKKLMVMVAAMVAGVAVLYLFGTAWFMVVYARNSGPVGLATALGWCVFPFILPDLIKLALAVFLTKRLGRHIKG